ncbi:DUF2179 domain-containing protein [Spirochaetota bacterium]
MNGKGMDGDVSIIYMVSPKKKIKKALRLVREYHPKAFITIEDVRSQYGGFESKKGVFSKVGRTPLKMK